MLNDTTSAIETSTNIILQLQARLENIEFMKQYKKKILSVQTLSQKLKTVNQEISDLAILGASLESQQAYFKQKVSDNEQAIQQTIQQIASLRNKEIETEKQVTQDILGLQAKLQQTHTSLLLDKITLQPQQNPNKEQLLQQQTSYQKLIELKQQLLSSIKNNLQSYKTQLELLNQELSANTADKIELATLAQKASKIKETLEAKQTYRIKLQQEENNYKQEITEQDYIVKLWFAYNESANQYLRNALGLLGLLKNFNPLVPLSESRSSINAKFETLASAQQQMLNINTTHAKFLEAFKKNINVPNKEDRTSINEIYSQVNNSNEIITAAINKQIFSSLQSQLPTQQINAILHRINLLEDTKLKIVAESRYHSPQLVCLELKMGLLERELKGRCKENYDNVKLIYNNIIKYMKNNSTYFRAYENYLLNTERELRFKKYGYLKTWLEDFQGYLKYLTSSAPLNLNLNPKINANKQQVQPKLKPNPH